MRRWIHHGDRCGWKAGLMLALLLVSAVVLAAPATGVETSTRVPRPLIEKGQGERCVEDTEFMRRNHMTLLKHQRDQTVHNGIRTRQHSLNGCIECHASRRTGSVIGSNENFCQACHSYAAVQLDCFECHASKPASGAALLTTGGRQNAPLTVATPAGGPPASSAPRTTAQ